MNGLLKRADPAADYEVDTLSLRALVEERIGVTPIARPEARHPWKRPWVIAFASFVAVLAVAIPMLLSPNEQRTSLPIGTISSLPGVESVIPLASGGVQTMAIDGDDIWVMTALQNVLQRVSMSSNQIERTFRVDGYVEGVVSGAGYLWLLSYDNGGEVLRFDPTDGVVDLTIPLAGDGYTARWFGGRLFASNAQGELFEISTDGDVLSRSPGSLRGEGFGLLWVLDPEDGSIRSLSAGCVS